MAYFSTFTGDTLEFYAPLRDFETGSPVDPASIDFVEVKLNGSLEYRSDTGAEVTIEDVDGVTSVVVRVDSANTSEFSGYIPVTVRVTLMDGYVTTVSNGTILCIKTQIS